MNFECQREANCANISIQINFMPMTHVIVSNLMKVNKPIYPIQACAAQHYEPKHTYHPVITETHLVPKTKIQLKNYVVFNSIFGCSNTERDQKMKSKSERKISFYLACMIIAHGYVW